MLTPINCYYLVFAFGYYPLDTKHSNENIRACYNRMSDDPYHMTDYTLVQVLRKSVCHVDET